MLAQRSFEDLGTPLEEVTFCVVDLETTGGSPATSAITEVGAVKVKRGEIVGTFQTLVDPGQPVPAFVRLLTGIDEGVLAGAPPIDSVLPSLLEFVRDTVLVAHNARFDMSFLNTALVERGYGRLPNRVLDTAALARKVVAGEVPNHRLATLASYLRCAHQPCHRAFADVLATIDVLHHLIERVAGFGVVTLEDLAALSASRLDGTFSKISLAQGLPKGCGVYRFVGATGNTLYVGKATDVRSRVRSYFYGDPRRKIKDLLRETQAITVEAHPSLLEAEIAEARAIQRELPPYNRVGKRSATWYVKASTAGRRGKVAPARAPRDDGSFYLGPFRSVKVVRTLIDCLRDAAHHDEMAGLIERLRHDPRPLYGALEDRMRRLARAHRYEEAAEVRDRAALLERTLARNARIDALISGAEIVVRHGQRVLLIGEARLLAAVDVDDDGVDDVRQAIERARRVAVAPEPRSYLTAEQLAEAGIICTWIDRAADDIELLAVSGTWTMPIGARPTNRFAPVEP